MQLEVRRNSNDKATPGEMFAVPEDWLPHDTTNKGTFLVYTLEPSQVNPDHPAIPAGNYRMVLGWSNHFKRNVPHILDVPGRLYIEIHPGNSVEDTEGCTLVGRSFDNKTNLLLMSVAGFNFLMSLLLAEKDQTFMVRYIDTV